MPTTSAVQDLAKISQYLWSIQILKDKAFSNGSINNGRDELLYMQRRALDYGISQNLSGIQGIANNVYSLIGAKVQLANQILVSGSGGITTPTTGGSISFRSYRSQFNVGDIGSLFVDGSTTATIDIGNGSNFISNSIQIELDQSILPQNVQNYVSYTVSYAAGIVTIILNQPAQTGQLYVITFDYIII